MSKTVCIDMDSVIVDLMSEWYRRYNLDYDDDLCLQRVLDWDATTYVKKECGYKIYNYLNEKGFFKDLLPLPNSVEVLERISKRYELIIVTSPPSITAYEEKEYWLNKFLPFISRESIIFTHRKELIDGDLLFDDSPIHLENYMKKGKKVVAMDYPYNRHINCNRVVDWIDFEKKIDDFINKNSY
jgi:5'-nucleotidase